MVTFNPFAGFYSVLSVCGIQFVLRKILISLRLII